MKSILSIAVIAICVGMYFMYIKPLTVDIKILSSKKSEYTQVLNRVKEIKEKREAILAEYNSISPDEIDRLNKVIPEKVNSVALLNDLSVIAERYGISIKDFKLAEADVSGRDVLGNNGIGSHKTTAMTMHLSGRYDQFLNFLEEIEYSLSLIDVVTLNILPGAPSKTGEAGQMEFTLEANTYSLR